MKIFYFSENSRAVGKIEYLKPIILISSTLLTSSAVPSQILLPAVELAVNTSLDIIEPEWTIPLLKLILFGQNKDKFDGELRELYMQLYIEELFFSKQFKELVQKVDDVIEEFPKKELNMKFIKGLSMRYLEREEDPLYYRTNVQMVYSLYPRLPSQRESLREQIKRLEGRLRKSGEMDLLNLMWEMGVDITLYPSRYQRTSLHIQHLQVYPVWQLEMIEKKEYKDRIEGIQKNWEEIRNEALTLLQHSELNKTRVEPEYDIYSKTEQIVFSGPHLSSFPPSLCAAAPITCSLLKKFPEAADCAYGYIMITVLEPGAVIYPHGDKTNTKLRVHLTLDAADLSFFENNPQLPAAGLLLAQREVIGWETGKLAIFDPSFEHQMWNQGDQRVVILSFDVDHPELGVNMRKKLRGVFDGKTQEEDLGISILRVPEDLRITTRYIYDQFETNESEGKQSKSNQSESNQSESNQSENNQSESNQSESNQSESKPSESKQSEANQSESKQSEANQSESKQSESN
ncbi:uncharacterized protein LOC111707259 [Eurytemora carolleeae]|uniref:uncharacterized protein LOC111707259 n=1 Tax=Eurytemora carolleeae TaxID=1294199 RepID=UPI000C75C238|nr:uncharacterized protein LOC111707259 [Eurytemora carolleeae]|eukprot:XP_023336096.1 uncharacterized protein LOC111707259 [Eurytemora affinis]